MLYTVLLVSEVLLSVSLITLVLMQHGKGADAGAAFGGGASGTVFGSQGAANFLSRTTGILAAAFFLNCLALAYIVANRTEAESIFDTTEKVQVESAPAATEVKDSAADIPELGSKPSPNIAPDVPALADDLPAVPAADDAARKPADIPE